MKCLCCDAALTVLFDDFELLGCDACKVLWFTQGQFERIDFDSDMLKDFATSECEVHLEKEVCPACNLPLHFHKYPSAPQVSFADCYSCGGAALTATQLLEIRRNSMNEAQLEAYRSQLAHSVEGFTQAEDVRVRRQGVSGFAKAWQKWRFWKKEEEK